MKTFAFAALASLALAAPALAEEWAMIKAPLKTAPDVVMTFAINDAGTLCRLDRSSASCDTWTAQTDLVKSSILEHLMEDVDTFSDLTVVATAVNDVVMLNVPLVGSEQAVTVNTRNGQTCIMYANGPDCDNWGKNGVVKDGVISVARNLFIDASDASQVFDLATRQTQ